MLRFLRKARQKLIGQNKIYNYLLYAFGEICLVVIGILIALQINNSNEERQRRNTELQIYENLREEISTDGEIMLGQLKFNSAHFEQFTYANEIIESNDQTKIDTLGWIGHNLLSYSDFNKTGNIYETMVNSGQISILRNPDIIDGIRNLEETLLYINRMENIHYDAILDLIVPYVGTTVKLSDGLVKRPEKLYTFEFQNLVLLLLRIMEEKGFVYQRAIDQINSLTALIDDELTADTR